MRVSGETGEAYDLYNSETMRYWIFTVVILQIRLTVQAAKLWDSDQLMGLNT